MREIVYLDVCCVKRPFDDAAIDRSTSDSAAARARLLTAIGFKPLDALHLAFAEQAAARWFVTTDHRLLNRATTERERLRLEVVFPDQVPLPGRGDQR